MYVKSKNMQKKIGITLFALTILSLPNQVFAGLKLDLKSYYYGFLIGSLSESCLFYENGIINAKVLRKNYESIFINVTERDKEVQNAIINFSNDEEFPCKDFVPYKYKN